MKKVLKRVLVFVLCLSLFCFPMSFSFASSGSLLPANVVTWDDVSADGKALAEAYVNMIQSGSNLQIKEMFKSMTDVPLNYFKLLSDGSWVLSPVENIYYYFKDGEFYVHEEGHGGGGGTRPGEEDSGHGGGGGDRPATSSDVYIPSEDLVDFIEQENTTTDPKGKDLFKQSYWTDTYIRSELTEEMPYVTLFNNSERNESFEDLYLYPFFVKGDGLMRYTDYQYHFYYKTGYDANSDLGLFVDTYKYTDGLGWVLQDWSGCKLDLFEQSNKPFTISVSPPIYDVRNTYFSTFSSSVDYSNRIRSNIRTKYLVSASSRADDSALVFTSVDKTVSEQIPTGYFNKKYGEFNDKGSDIGFICSHSMIERTYKDIDTSKIPPNQIINITGDTIYDYSITNPDTGASTTINEYVTNNYYYPEVPSTSEPSGGVGGNVNVGGNISVGGQVDVNIGVSVPDININVNQGSGAGGSGTGINPGDILDGSSVDLDKYYDDAVSQASGVRAFLGQFFDFLPAELVGLICMLVAVAIVCRIFGR